ncbi:flavodoxin domain-containing protein [Blastococcus saxobsidens]|uniref:Menaquinone-dependent protoporphyrinogen oxidase n=1 Tax=Blastococcus saxobsidens TaxID=138336 RepID=A0A4Q7YAD1_9ACTN|nr:flavodoxin domain-containing protein [Blastococcus saxobsidens]RZU33353.1 menaquinone-dependent protoporphyrinogen oxidase [Blastococcus saxobsidens]
MSTTLDTTAMPPAAIGPGGGPTAPRHGRGPRVLVVFAGRHGSTREIAARLARYLTQSEAGRRTGLHAALAPAQSRPDPEPFTGVVLGSAVYGGAWLEPARGYLETHADALARRATWSFSSGMWGQEASPSLRGESSPWVHELTGRHEHRWFRGRTERRLLSAAELHAWPRFAAPAGDQRDWQAVRAWAAEIAGALEAVGANSRDHQVV